MSDRFALQTSDLGKVTQPKQKVTPHLLDTGRWEWRVYRTMDGANFLKRDQTNVRAARNKMHMVTNSNRT